MTGMDLEAVESAAEVRARDVEEQLTDDERFSLVISIMGPVPGMRTGGRDPRIPDDVTNLSAGTYKVALGKAADALDLTAETTLTEARFGN